MIITRKEKELITMSSATMVVASANFAMTATVMVADGCCTIINSCFSGARYLGESKAEKDIKKHKINSNWWD